MNIKDYHLKSGTLLDERYQIETVIGEGGFGITYSGFSLHQKDKKIAIKEFYLKDCMDRDCRSSNVVQILREEDEEYCKRQKQRFLKVRILETLKPSVFNLFYFVFIPSEVPYNSS